MKARDGRQLGSAEVLQDFEPILETAKEEGNFYLSLYANSEHRAFSVELQDSEKYPLKGNFIRVIGVMDSSVERLITDQLLVFAGAQNLAK